ncbi:MAG TPA: EAL domain-containing protein [Nevskia sp.]|nr:EAL domain-containing protein [Nevskia sp.]
MTGRRRRTVLFALVALAGLLPTAGFMLISWKQAQREMNTQLQRYASHTLDRADQIFGNAETTLAQLAGRLEPRCTPATVQGLGRAVLESIYFQEATLVVDDAVRCTNTQVYNPPQPIANAENRVIPAQGIHISAPVTLARENMVSIVIHYRAGERSMFGLHLNPRLLGEPEQKYALEDGISLAVLRSDGAELARCGLHPELPLARLPGARVALQSARYPIRVVAVASPSWLTRNWKQDVLAYVSAGLMTSALLCVLLLMAARRQLSASASMEDALDDGQFQVYYQPMVDAMTGGCVGAESLLRWHHPQLGVLSPDAFIPAAEESGFIVKLTRWLMRRIITDMAELLMAHPELHVSVNLSPQHLAERSLLADIKRMTGDRIAPGQIVIEVTEHELIMNEDRKALEMLQQIRALGTPIALDDFGSGYSSLRYLSSFPFDYLKIDKAFIDAIGTESLTAGLVDTIVSMARQFRLKIVAEGVETPAQLAYLQGLKVDYVQGWLFSKALPVDRFRAWFASNHAYMLGVRASQAAQGRT